MKKSERIQQELFFLNGRKTFNLRDIMAEFAISKRTALRDIQELERLGLPLYTENGRTGGYRLLDNALLPPLYFTEKEIFTIFYSLQTLDLLKESPFGNSHRTLQKKLLQTFNAPKQQRIIQMMGLIHYEGVEQIAFTQNLEELLGHILNNNIITIQYVRYGEQNKTILPIRLTMMDGYWYCTALDITKKAWRTYRCDFIKQISLIESQQTTFSLDYLKESYTQQQSAYRTIPLKVKVTALGQERFLKSHFPTISLKKIKDETYIVGKFHKSELAFLTTYFLAFGEHIEIVDPPILKEAYIKALQKILSKY